jgi:hypothetical protein
MNETEAKKLTERIVGTWPASPKGFVWTETLLGLDFGPALAAVGQLTRTHDETRLSVPRFLAAYRVVTTTGNTHRDTEAVCSWCGGDGWVTVEPLECWGYEYSQMHPCTCSAGRRSAASAVWQRRESRPA